MDTFFRVIDLPPACPGVMSKASTRPSQNAPASAHTLEDHRGEGDSLQQALQHHCFDHQPLEFVERCRDHRRSAIGSAAPLLSPPAPKIPAKFASVRAPRWARHDTCFSRLKSEIVRPQVARSLRARLSIPGNMPISRDPLPRWDRPACASLVRSSRDSFPRWHGPACASRVSSESQTEIHPSAEPLRPSVGTGPFVLQQQTFATHG